MYCKNIRVIILLPVNHSPQVIKQWDYVVTLFLTSLLRKSLECVFLKWLTWSHTDSNNSHVLSCFFLLFWVLFFNVFHIFGLLGRVLTIWTDVLAEKVQDCGTKHFVTELTRNLKYWDINFYTKLEYYFLNTNITTNELYRWYFGSQQLTYVAIVHKFGSKW